MNRVFSHQRSSLLATLRSLKSQSTLDKVRTRFSTSSPISAMVNTTSSSSGQVDYGHFSLLKSVDIDYAPVKLSKWRSDRTGLTVVVGNHSSPVTNGYFTIASEIFDDTGRPHTLEHLVFLGSKAYPYKGVLDQLANRAGSNGTNAWTANDRKSEGDSRIDPVSLRPVDTAYTISTAGSDGFLKMLPSEFRSEDLESSSLMPAVYLDHILHPTITDAGFVTEVHHINGAGEDAGVVYSEMQARENQSGDLMELQSVPLHADQEHNSPENRKQRMLYPQSSAYRSETGGLMSMLRVLTAQQSQWRDPKLCSRNADQTVRDYHSKYYVPHNVGQLFEIPSLMTALSPHRRRCTSA